MIGYGIVGEIVIYLLDLDKENQKDEILYSLAMMSIMFLYILSIDWVQTRVLI